MSFALACAACSGPAPAPPTPPVSPAPPPASAEPEAKPPTADAKLLKRALLFGNPDRTAPRIRPDGKQLAYLAPKDGVMNVFVGDVDKVADAKPVTNDTKRGIRRYFWAYDNRHIVYLQDQGGDENWRVYSVDVTNNERTDLTPIDGVRAEINGVSHKFPNAILVGLNDRDKKLHDLYRIDLRSAKRTLVQQNDEGFVGYVTDDDYRARVALKFTPKGGMAYHFKKGTKWAVGFEVGPEDSLTTNPRGFDRSGRSLYLVDSRNRDKAAFVSMNLANQKVEVVHASDKADVGNVMLHPTRKTPQAASVSYLKQSWTVLDKTLEADFAELAKLDGEVAISGRTLDDKKWIVSLSDDDGPTKFYFYDRATKKPTFLFSSRKALEGVDLSPMHPVVIKSRDGKDLVSYLTLPKAADADGDARPDKPLPMVLMVHGGPWGRDRWGFNPYHQWMASRGYAVLSVNFRGSTGFGKAFINAGDKEWAAKMHDDLIDAVKWAKAEKIAGDTAIMGGSYGGYSTLVGLTFTPETFACGVDIVGPSNLITLLENIPPYWAPFLPVLTQRVGDTKTPQGRRFLAERSPLTHAAKIVRPLLIGQGANDPRVKQQESDQIVQAMKSNEIPVTYVLYPDEGHGFARPQNRLSFFAITDVFLAQCLGGTYQPIGDDFAGSSVQVPEGAAHVHSLADALK
jgi:dipeptidyl aminopeptidase/acylaminoacyl peptidase